MVKMDALERQIKRIGTDVAPHVCVYWSTAVYKQLMHPSRQCHEEADGACNLIAALGPV
jgi:hypothetical protein